VDKEVIGDNSNMEPVITPAETFRALTRIEAKQDTILVNQQLMIKEHDVFEDRIGRVEKRQTIWAAYLTAAAGVIAFLGPEIRKAVFG